MLRPLIAITLLATSVASAELRCEITSLKESYEVGDAVELRVRIVNETDRTLTLPGGMDASDVGWRYPYATLTFDGPNGPIPLKGIGRCGNMNDPLVTDFVEVAPGASFYPIEPPHWENVQLRRFVFTQPGEHTVRFRYEVGTDPDEWRDGLCIDCPLPSYVMAKIAQVEPVTLQCDITVDVHGEADETQLSARERWLRLHAQRDR